MPDYTIHIKSKLICDCSCTYADRVNNIIKALIVQGTMFSMHVGIDTCLLTVHTKHDYEQLVNRVRLEVDMAAECKK